MFFHVHNLDFCMCMQVIKIKVGKTKKQKSFY